MGHNLLLAAFSGYFAALGVYAYSLTRDGGNADFIAGILLRIAMAAQTVAFLLRWLDGGVQHPPFVSLHESLVFFAGCAAGAQIYMETRYKMRWSGIFAAACAGLSLLLAFRLPDGVGALPPLLLSKWLYLHALTGFLAYGFFAIAAFLSLFFLIRDGIGTDRLLAGFSLVAATLLALAGGRAAFVSREFRFTAVVPGGAAVLCVAFGAFALHALLAPALAGRPLPKTGKHPARWLGAAQEELDWVGFTWRGLFVLGMATLLALSGVLVWAGRKVPEVSFAAHPFRLMGLVTAFALGALALFFVRFRPDIEKRLPKPEKLDRWSYQAILMGFLLMTLSLLSGSVWAYFGWTRYWGWDPKEIWALATWLVYVHYLHVRVVHAHSTTTRTARRTAIIAIVGLAVTLFAFLGAQLLLPGLHHFEVGTRI